jgi:hypothetical protein
VALGERRLAKNLLGTDEALLTKLNAMLEVTGSSLKFTYWMTIHDVARCVSVLEMTKVYIWEWSDDMYLLREPCSGLSLTQYRHYYYLLLSIFYFFLSKFLILFNFYLFIF